MIMEKFHVDENKSWFHKWWPEGVPFNTEFEEISLGDFFEKQRKKYPDSNIIWFIDTWMSYDEIGKYIDSMNYLNQMICESKVSEMKALESLGVDEYYMTLHTWVKIIDEKNKAMDGGGETENQKSSVRKKLKKNGG